MLISATGFLAFGELCLEPHDQRQKTGRFPGDQARRIGGIRTSRFGRVPPACRPDPSHTVCVGSDDLASVSPIMRSVSRRVRRSRPPVSANVRRKQPLIARPADYHCASLQLCAEIELERLLEILAADCQWMRPGRKARLYEARCGVRFTDIDRVGPPPDLPPGGAVPILTIVRG